MAKNWFNFFTAQFMGVLNDNLLKNLICFISVYWAPEDSKGFVIAAASASMVLPFIFLSPLAGYLSQLHNRKVIFEKAKLFEIPIMLFALTGFILNSLPVVIIAMLLMGAQSALYSPAKYGLIKDMALEDNVANKLGTMELLSFLGVLTGSMFAGYVADFSEKQILIIGISLVSIALIGFRSSKQINLKDDHTNPNAIRELNPFRFLLNSYKTSRQYKGVNASIFGLGAFWFIGSMIQMNILVHCPDVLDLSNTQTGLVTAFIAVGIGLGCFVSGKILKHRLEMGLIVFAGIFLTLTTFLLSGDLNTPSFIVVIMLSAFFGGLFKIPLNAWVQQRTETKELSNILAYSNMIVFIFILLSAIIFGVLQMYFDSYQIFAFIASFTFFITAITFYKILVAVLRFAMLVLNRMIYKVDITGEENIPLKKGGILISNHVSILDALIIIGIAPRNFRFIMHDKVYNHKILGFFFKRLNMIPVSSGKSPKDLERFNQLCVSEVKKGHIICLFPEGQLSRSGMMGGFKKGAEKLSENPDVSLFPMHMDNVVGTPMTYKIGQNKRYGFGLRSLRNTVYISVGEPINRPVKSHELYQNLKNLEIENFRRHVSGLNMNLKIAVSKRRVMKKAYEAQTCEKLTLSALTYSCPDFTLKDLMGKPVKIKGNKAGSIGKPLPGVNISIRNGNFELLPPSQTGHLFIKHAFGTESKWTNTHQTGYIDFDGFVFVSK